ncbi:MAG: hypothetical protein INH41_14325 [Myxococcaceae bacterium]|nr:hypothetical protein [Myxococcaceae bacterium]MCA3013555.1 hypothetical protein [Myxococcaceae bacterium]
MRWLITMFWSLACVGVGVALATVEVSGRTPLQHAERAWRTDGAKRLDAAKGTADDLVADVKKKVSGAVKDAKDRPLDKHSADERSALDQLIADRQREGK